MAQFIVNLNNSMPANEKFIVHMLDSTHMFVQPHVAEMIKSKIAEFRDQNSYEKPQWELEMFFSYCLCVCVCVEIKFEAVVVVGCGMT
jgi:TFIIH basal transcription factor complex TTD-A subunit